MSLLRSAASVGSLQFVTALLRFGRNVLLARLLGDESFGLALTYSLVVGLAEAISNIGLWQFVVHNREGNDARFLSVIQTLLLCRGIALAAAIFLLAEPLALFLATPDLAPYYQALALVPLINAVKPIERIRRERGFNYGLTARTDVSSLLLSVVLVPVLAPLLPDHRLMPAILVTEVVARSAITLALVAEPIRLGWSGSVGWQAFAFGWPYLLGAPVAFATANSERIIVANALTAAELGQLGATLALVIAPQMLLQRISGILLFTRIAQVRNAGGDVAEAERLAFEAQTAISATAGLALATLGPAAVLLAFGPGFHAAADYAVLASGLAMLPLLRTGFANVAAAAGRTGEPLVADLARLAAVLPAYLLAVRGAGIEGVLLAAIGGEFAAIAVAFVLHARHVTDRAMVRRLLRLLSLGLTVSLLALTLHWMDWGALWGIPVPPPLPVIGLTGLLLVLLRDCRLLRRKLANAARRIVRRLRRGS